MSTADAGADTGRWRRRLTGVLCLCQGLVAEAYVGWQYWTRSEHSLGLGLGLVLLVPTGAVLVAYGLERLTRGDLGVAFWLYAGLTGFIPVYGAVGSVAIALYLRRAPTGRLAEEFIEYIDAEQGNVEEDEDALSRGTVDQMVWHELNVQSYMDIMKGPDRGLKKALISRILSEWTPNSVALLRQGLKDPEYEIRSYSSTALTAIENRMSERIQSVRAEAERAPQDGSVALKLAQSYLDYAASGLLDEGSARHYVRLGSEIMDSVPEPDPQDPEWRTVLSMRGAAARVAGDSAAAETAYRAILRHQPDDQEALSHLCALLFEQRRLAELNVEAGRLATLADTEDPMAAAARFWTRQRQEVA